MIIKEKSIKTYKNMEKTLRYILSKDDQKEHFIFKRFIKGDRKYVKQLERIQHDTEAESIIDEQRLQNFIRQFKENDKERIHKRRGETKYYHSIISFHASDNLTQDQLQKVITKYTKERFPKSIVVGTNHDDQDHQHIHLVGSSVEYSLGTTRYLKRDQFKEVKMEMERWQEKTLNLVHSRVNHSKKNDNYFMMPNTN